MDGGNGKKAIVYTTKEEKGREGRKKRKKHYVPLSHSIRASPRILSVSIYANNSFLATL